VFMAGWAIIDFGESSSILTIGYSSNGSPVWIARWDGKPASMDAANDLVLDPTGNVIVTGYSIPRDEDAQFVTLKYDSDGNELWTAAFASGESGDPLIDSAVASDPTGNVYVTAFRNIGENMLTTVKYGPDGDPIWNQDIAAAPAGAGKRTVSSSGQDRIVVCATVALEDPPGNGILTIAYDAEGNELWSAVYPVLSACEDYFIEIPIGAAGMTVDRDQNVFVTGTRGCDGSDYKHSDAVTVKYDADGSELWSAVYVGSGRHDSAAAIDLDPGGNPVVTGWSDGQAFAASTVKYDADGNELWASRFEDGCVPRPVALVVNDSGRSTVAMKSCWNCDWEEESCELITVQYDPQGGERWVDVHQGLSMDFGHIPCAMEGDARGNAYVSGISYFNYYRDDDDDDDGGGDDDEDEDWWEDIEDDDDRDRRGCGLYSGSPAAPLTFGLLLSGWLVLILGRRRS